MMHTFPIDDDNTEENEKLLCIETLYVSDTATESHFPFKGNKNRGMSIKATRLSPFVIDFGTRCAN
jgi:hypothetical protein